MKRIPSLAFFVLVGGLLIVTAPGIARAQSKVDEQQLFLARIQTDERALVLKSMQLDDDQVAVFTPIYDAYQSRYKKVMDRAVELIEYFNANNDSLTDDDAGRLLKQWFDLKRDEDDLIRAYARKMERVLPETKVLRFIQIESRVSATLRLTALHDVPLAK